MFVELHLFHSFPLPRPLRGFCFHAPFERIFCLLHHGAAIKPITILCWLCWLSFTILSFCIIPLMSFYSPYALNAISCLHLLDSICYQNEKLFIGEFAGMNVRLRLQLLSSTSTLLNFIFSSNFNYFTSCSTVQRTLHN